MSESELSLFEKIGAWLDGELDAGEAEQVAALVQADEAAAGEAVRLRKLNAIGTGLEAPQVSDAQWDAAFAGIMQQSYLPENKPKQIIVPPAPERVRQPVLLGLLATLAAVLLIFSYLPRDVYQDPPVLPPDDVFVVGDAPAAQLESITWDDDSVNFVMYEQLDDECFVLYIDMVE
ncbi:anti-sigma factor family protein [Planctomycetota bacterium]